MGQDLLPGIPFHAELKVAFPDMSGNTLLNKPCRHMVVEFLTPREHIAQGSTQSLRSLKELGYRINRLFVIARLMSLDRRSDRGYDVLRATLPRQKNLDAGARSFCRLDKNKFMFVRNDHREGRNRGTT